LKVSFLVCEQGDEKNYIYIFILSDSYFEITLPMFGFHSAVCDDDVNWFSFFLAQEKENGRQTTNLIIKCFLHFPRFSMIIMSCIIFNLWLWVVFLWDNMRDIKSFATNYEGSGRAMISTYAFYTFIIKNTTASNLVNTNS
jgi:hypothetical protein